MDGLGPVVRATIEVKHALVSLALCVREAAVRLMEAFAAVLRERQHAGGSVIGSMIDLAAACTPCRALYEFADLLRAGYIRAVLVWQLDLHLLCGLESAVATAADAAHDASQQIL